MYPIKQPRPIERLIMATLCAVAIGCTENQDLDPNSPDETYDNVSQEAVASVAGTSGFNFELDDHVVVTLPAGATAGQLAMLSISVNSQAAEVETTDVSWIPLTSVSAGP